MMDGLKISNVSACVVSGDGQSGYFLDTSNPLQEKAVTFLVACEQLQHWYSTLYV